MTAEARGKIDQPAEIGKISRAPAVLGMQGIKRTEESPALSIVQWRVCPGRRADEIALDFESADLQIEPMVAERDLPQANQPARDIARAFDVARDRCAAGWSRSSPANVAPLSRTIR